MLARVVLDYDALVEGPRDDLAQYRCRHEDLIEVLLRHGVIVLATDEEELRAVIDRLPQSVKKLWKSAYQRLRWQVADPPPPTSLCSIQDLVHLRANWHGKADIAAVERVRALLLGVPEDEVSWIDEESGLEITRFDLIRKARRFERLQRLAESPIRAGEQRESIWQQRFKLLARHAKHLVICDRYAGVGLCRHYDALDDPSGGPSSRGKKLSRESGLRWLLMQVDQCPKTYVHLILGAESQDKSRILGAVRRLRTELCRGGVADLKLTLVPGHVFGKDGHDRHIRFDHQAFTVGPGLDIFSRKAIAIGNADCHYLSERAVKDKEKALVGQAGSHSWPTEVPI